MKKAKVVVNQASKNSRIKKNKRAAWLTTAGVIAALGVVSVVVPTSNIPGFGYLARTLGLNGAATRNLTMADFASYAVGAKDNKISQMQNANGYYGAGGEVSGLSPFSTLNNDRLAQAYAKSSEEAYEMEKALSGQISAFDNTNLDTEITLDQDMLSKGIDPTKLSNQTLRAQDDAMAALAAAAGLQRENFGKPVNKSDLPEVAGLVNFNAGGANMSNIVGTANIEGIANKNDLLYARLQRDAKALMGTSIFGSVNPEFTRTDTSIGRPVYGLFKDLGTAFFFSRYAAGSKLPTAAEDIAVAAFQGGSPQDESIITKDETPAAPDSSAEEELSQGANSVNICSQYADTYKEYIKAISQTITAYLEIMFQIREAEGIRSGSNILPGCCIPVLGANNKTLSARHKWNYYLYGGGVQEHMDDPIPHVSSTLEDLCNSLIGQRNALAGQCGIEFAQPEYSCSQMAQKLKLGSCLRRAPGQCPDISIFGSSDSSMRISKRKLRKYQNRYKYYRTRSENPLPEGEAMQAAAVDARITEPDTNGDVNAICTTAETCLEYINEVLEKTFAMDDILDIRDILSGFWGEDKPATLRHYDAGLLKSCQSAGDMSDCQDVIDYYSGGEWEDQCGQYNSMLNNPDSSTYSDCDIIWLAINGKL